MAESKSQAKGRPILSARISAQLRDRIHAAAEYEGISVPDWHRDALLSAVRRAEQQRRARESREVAQ